MEHKSRFMRYGFMTTLLPLGKSQDLPGAAYQKGFLINKSVTPASPLAANLSGILLNNFDIPGF
jgi:hypothetical protein